jgi:N-acetyl-beta-hexosaminidase
MDNKIFKNSYVMAILAFLLLSLVFYLAGIGYTTSVNKNGIVEKKFSYKYPLALALLIWLLWHFCLFPPPESAVKKSNTQNMTYVTPQPKFSMTGGYGNTDIYSHKINMANWR